MIRTTASRGNRILIGTRKNWPRQISFRDLPSWPTTFFLITSGTLLREIDFFLPLLSLSLSFYFLPCYFSLLFSFFPFFEKLSYYQRTILKRLFEEEETSVSEITSTNRIIEIKFLPPQDYTSRASKFETTTSADFRPANSLIVERVTRRDAEFFKGMYDY